MEEIIDPFESMTNSVQFGADNVEALGDTTVRITLRNGMEVVVDQVRVMGWRQTDWVVGMLTLDIEKTVVDIDDMPGRYVFTPMIVVPADRVLDLIVDISDKAEFAGATTDDWILEKLE